MKRYEHKIESVSDMVGPLAATASIADILARLNELGAEGWRLVCILGDQAAVFAREVPVMDECVYLVRADCVNSGVSHVADSEKSAEWLRDSDERIEAWPVEKGPK